ncbi:MAG TPA: 50S ribosomal protein L25 [Candidatus Saccharimonadales bacterium]|nr:50S ribosomal protein L25 [Candidatus Saccharimonadales bacterium]
MTDETMSVELTPRDITGKAVKHLREDGQVPAVIHNHGKASVLVQGPYLTLQHLYQRAGRHHPVVVKAGGKTYTTLIKSASFEPHHNKLTHLVFNAVSKTQKVEAEVPVRARYAEGNDASPAERSSLIVLEQLTSVPVRAVPDKIPDVLEYDAELLVADGDQVTVAQLVVPDGVEVLEDAEHPVATVYEPSALQAANDAAGGAAEPEETAAAAEGEAAERSETAEADENDEKKEA